MAPVRYDEVVRVFSRDDRPAVDSLTLEVADGELLVLVGPSGCGKSTTLRMLAGLESIDAGSVWIGNRDVTRVSPKDRDIAMVFQNYALYPHMTVEQNMGFALKMAHISRSETKERVGDAARLLGLEEYLSRKPRTLSGGQRQRVAMGRAIVRRPRAFLMDEPLSNLDAKLRVQTRTEISALQRRLGTTMLYVTHDQVEAMTMGDRVAVMNEGRLQQIDTPKALYAAPANVFVAGFIGSPPMNLYEAQLNGEDAVLNGFAVRLPRDVLVRAGRRDGASVILGFRPEATKLAGESEPGFPAIVEEVEELGADAYVYASFDDGRERIRAADVAARVPASSNVNRGDHVRLSVDPEAVQVFSADTGESLA
jgi:multiple sugar transport system ATP-binding protein